MDKTLIALILTLVFASCIDNNIKNKTTGIAKVKQIASPALDSSALPSLFTDKNGLVYLSWVEKKGKESTFKFSALVNEQWSDPSTISSGNNWFVNWADYPMLTCDGNNNLLAHFLEKSDTGKFTYDIKMISSGNAGKTWSDPRILNEDGKKAEHGFVSMIPYGDNFFVTWLDGRNAAMEHGSGGHEGHHGQMSSRGAIIDKQGKKTNEWELDNRVCDCCQTTAALTTAGPVVVYRDRSDNEIRDISIVRYINGTWTEPETIFPDNWEIKGCPVNGPRADAIGDHLVIAWFTMQEKNGIVNLIFSDDGGTNFNKPIRIDEGKPIGRVDVVLLDEKSAMVSWMEGADIKVVKVNKDGTKENSIMIASSTDKRSSGFPQMTRSGKKLFFAWTDDSIKTINVASLPL